MVYDHCYRLFEHEVPGCYAVLFWHVLAEAGCGAVEMELLSDSVTLVLASTSCIASTDRSYSGCHDG